MLIFDKSVCGRRAVTLPALDVPEYNLDENFVRNAELNLPEVAEIDLVRHYIGLSLKAKGVDNVFYPLGSCTMKYNPKLNEVLARNPAFTSVHPLQPASTVQGSLEVMYDAAKSLAEITGMDEISLEPAAGAHGEYEFAGNKEVPFVKGRLKAQQDYRARQRARHKPRKRGNVRL